MRSFSRRLIPTRTVVVALALLLGLLITPQAQAAAAVVNSSSCPPPPVCMGSGCNPWQCSTIQAGYYAHDAAAHLNAVKGDFVTHCFSGEAPPPYSYAAWVGIGGDNPSKQFGGNLVQTGAAWNGANYSAFYEFPYNTNGPTYGLFTIPCNTTVEAQVYQNASGQFCTLVTWPPYPTNSQYDSLSHCFSSAWTPDQTTAEWVDERQTCTPFALETTAWSNAYAYSPEKNWHTLAYWPRTAVYMSDLTNHILEVPSNPILSATTFNDVTTNRNSNDAC